MIHFSLFVGLSYVAAAVVVVVVVGRREGKSSLEWDKWLWTIRGSSSNMKISNATRSSKKQKCFEMQKNEERKKV